MVFYAFWGLSVSSLRLPVVLTFAFNTANVAAINLSSETTAANMEKASTKFASDFDKKHATSGLANKRKSDYMKEIFVGFRLFTERFFFIARGVAAPGIFFSEWMIHQIGIECKNWKKKNQIQSKFIFIIFLFGKKR